MRQEELILVEGGQCKMKVVIEERVNRPVYSISSEKILKLISSYRESDQEIKFGPLLGNPIAHSFEGLERIDEKDSIKFEDKGGNRGYVFLVSDGQVEEARRDRFCKVGKVYRKNESISVLADFLENNPTTEIFAGLYWVRRGWQV